MKFLLPGDNKLKLIVDDTFKSMKKLLTVQLQQNTCINQDFYKKNITSVVDIVKEKCGLKQNNLHLYLEYQQSLTKNEHESIVALLKRISKALQKHIGR